MAGPEDSTNATHHHGNADTPDKYLHGNDLEVDDDTSIAQDLLKQGHAPDMAEDASKGASKGIQENTPVKIRRVGFVSTPPQSLSDRTVVVSQPETSQPEDSETDRDVFDNTSHDKIFFVEDDDDDDDEEKEESEKKDLLSESSDIDVNSRRNRAVTNNETDVIEDQVFDSEDSDSDSSDDEVPDDATKMTSKHVGRSDKKEGPGYIPRRKSKPIPIERPKETSGLTASCRCSLAQVFVRCQISPNGRRSHMPHTFSCPAFSPRWKDVMTSVSVPGRPPRRSDRRLTRRYTVGNLFPDMQKQQQRKQREESKVDRDWSEDRQSQHPPSYRSRSYSDTDVNYHLNKEVGRELRRISDEFHFTYKGRQLTTVSEITDEDGAGDHHPSSSCP